MFDTQYEDSVDKKGSRHTFEGAWDKRCNSARFFFERVSQTDLAVCKDHIYGWLLFVGLIVFLMDGFPYVYIARLDLCKSTGYMGFDKSSFSIMSILMFLQYIFNGKSIYFSV